MIGFNYTKTPIDGQRSKQIVKNHPQKSALPQPDKKIKLPDKFSLSWK